VCSKSFWRCPDTKFGENLTWWKLPNEVIRSPFFIIEDADGFHPLLGIAFKDPMTPEEVMAAYNGLRGSFVKISPDDSCFQRSLLLPEPSTRAVNLLHVPMPADGLPRMVFMSVMEQFWKVLKRYEASKQSSSPDRIQLLHWCYHFSGLAVKVAKHCLESKTMEDLVALLSLRDQLGALYSLISIVATGDNSVLATAQAAFLWIRELETKGGVAALLFSRLSDIRGVLLLLSCPEGTHKSLA